MEGQEDRPWLTQELFFFGYQVRLFLNLNMATSS